MPFLAGLLPLTRQTNVAAALHAIALFPKHKVIVSQTFCVVALPAYRQRKFERMHSLKMMKKDKETIWHQRGTREYARDLKKCAGFTLLELLVVIVIIGLLAAYVGPKYFSQLSKSEVTVAKAQIEAFEKALDTFRLDVGRYPTSEEGLAALLTKPATASKWNGPYLKKDIPKDPWGNTYIYRSPGSKGEFDVISYGRDGQSGGSDNNADISN